MNLDFLKNKWMNSVAFLAQAGHFLLSYSLMLTLARFGVNPWWGIGGMALYSTVKEWWYDTYYEEPEQTWKDNLIDQVFLMGGILVGWLVSRSW